MGRPGEVAFLLALFLLLGIMHSIRAQYDHYDYEDYDEPDRYDFDEDEDVEDDYSQEEEADASRDAEGVSEEGDPPATSPVESGVFSMCNNEYCWTGSLHRGTPGCLASWDTGLDSGDPATNGTG